MERLGGKLDPRFYYGVFLGVVLNTGESLVACVDGTVTKVRTMKRLPLDERWDPEMARNIIGVPWDLTGKDESGNAPAVIEPRGQPAQVLPPHPELYVSRGRRRMPLKKQLFKDHGYSAGCGGCTAIIQGNSEAVNHTEACRTRIETAVASTLEGREELKRASDRLAEGQAQEESKRMRLGEQVPRIPTEESQTANQGGARAPTGVSAEPRLKAQAKVAPQGGATSQGGATQYGGASSSKDGSNPPKTTIQDATTTTTDDTMQNPGNPNDEDAMMTDVLPTGNISGPQGDIETEDESDPKRAKIQEVGEYPGDGYQERAQEHRIDEIFSPPRVVPVARLEGLPGGWSLDLTSVDSRGRAWDFDSPQR